MRAYDLRRLLGGNGNSHYCSVELHADSILHRPGCQQVLRRMRFEQRHRRILILGRMPFYVVQRAWNGRLVNSSCRGNIALDSTCLEPSPVWDPRKT